MADISRAIRLLVAIDLMRLDRCTSNAPEWLREIEDVIADLRGSGLPKNDPLRFDEDGNRLSDYDLHSRLQGLVNSWSK